MIVIMYIHIDLFIKKLHPTPAPASSYSSFVRQVCERCRSGGLASGVILMNRSIKRFMDPQLTFQPPFDAIPRRGEDRAAVKKTEATVGNKPVAGKCIERPSSQINVPEREAQSE